MRTLILWSMAAAALPAQLLTQGERDRAMSHLHASRKQFLDSIGGLSAAQWSYKPAPERWSVAEVAEHIAVTEESIFQLITMKVLKTPPVGEQQRTESPKRDEMVLKMVPDRSQRAQAPEFLRPAGRWPDRESLAAAFQTARGRNIAYAEKTVDPLRHHAAPHPVLGMLDGYQWLLLISAHTERHVAQIQEVRADPKFPR